MKTIHNTKIIGIDHGYGNMKTANCCELIKLHHNNKLELLPMGQEL